MTKLINKNKKLNFFSLPTPILRAALDRAVVLQKMSMGGLRIDNQWGTGGGQRPVIQLIKEVRHVFFLFGSGFIIAKGLPVDGCF